MKKHYALDWFEDIGWIVVVDVIDKNDELVRKENITVEKLRKKLKTGKIRSTKKIWFHDFTIDVVNAVFFDKYTTNH